jgi:2-polyprenyl-6-methoxyphenol hydroxylase-like FAD-dependent oxidoreductase
MAQQQQAGKTAVVIGASMAGLLAARALADYFAHVTILERDTLPPSAEPRKGVPQGQHAHALLASGQQILEELFPGFTQQLLNQGAIRGQGRFFSGGGYHCQIQQGPGGLFVSRPRLEAEVRARLLTLPHVHVIDNCDVQGLAVDKEGTRVIGARIIRRQSASAEEILPADLVVDASGRGSRTPAWLEALGYPKPAMELVEVGMGYATRLYRRQPEHLDGDLFVNVAPTRENKRACGMLAQEGERWIVTLAGYFGDYPPTDEQGFLEFARSLAVPDVYEVIQTATPLSEPIPFRFPANQRRHYETLTRFPDGFLVLGDALCSFTPIYGQGMAVAAQEALALWECLAAGTHQLAQRFFKQASSVVDIAWSITVGNDRSISDAEGSQPPMLRFINWYMRKLQIAARHDPQLAFAFQQVANLIAAPASLVQPRIALRVLWGNLRAARHGQTATARQESLSQPLHP